MLADIFKGIFDTDMTSVIAPSDFLLCVASALVIGLILAGFYMYRTRYTKSFVATLALLPAVVCVVIMMVNGNVGAGVAVAKFRRAKREKRNENPAVKTAGYICFRKMYNQNTDSLR